VAERWELDERRRRAGQMFTDHGAIQLLVDPDTLTLEEANAAAARFYGYPAESLPGRPLADLSIEPREAVAANVRGILSGERRWFRVRHRTALGEERVLDVHSTPVTVRGRTLLHSILQDVTDQERAGQVLRDTQARLSTLLLNLPNVAFYETGGGREFLSENVQRLTGYSAGELAADRRLFPSLIHPDDVGDVNARVREWHQAGEPGPLVNLFRLQRRDGACVWLEDHMVSVRPAEGRRYMSGVLIDVTERCSAAEALRESREALQRNEAHYRTLIENSLDVITILAADGTITYASPSMLHVLGYAPEDVVGRNAFEFVHAEELENVRAAHAQRLEDPPYTAGYEEFRLRHADGRWLVVHAMAQPIDTPDGPRLLVNSRDVTERCLLEEQLRHAQKMDAVGRLSGAVAHDFNNMLGVIAGYSQLLLERGPDEAVRRECLTEIAQATERAMRLTRQLLTFSRRQAVRREPLDLNAVVLGIEGLLRRAAGDAVSLDFDLEPAGAPAVVDAGQMEQVLMNLVANARDALPEGGPVHIRTRVIPRDEAGAAALGTGHDGPFVLLTVSDPGCGMAPEVLERVFEPFFTTKEKERGTGLGLATAYSVVEQSGGVIRAASEPGRGTTVSIYLPRHADPLAPAPSPTPAATGAPGGSETILLAEDDEPLRRLVAGLLAERGYRVLAAADGAAALELAGRRAEPIHLLLADVVMPGMTGPELAAALRPVRPETRVLFMSGQAAEGRLGGAGGGPADPLLPKPFTGEELARKVREVLG